MFSQISPSHYLFLSEELVKQDAPSGVYIKLVQRFEWDLDFFCSSVYVFKVTDLLMGYIELKTGCLPPTFVCCF